MTEPHIDYERIGQMVGKQVREALHGNGDVSVAAQLSEMTVRLAGIEKHTGELAGHQAAANHRIEKLEHNVIKQEGVHEAARAGIDAHGRFGVDIQAAHFHVLHAAFRERGDGAFAHFTSAGIWYGKFFLVMRQRPD